MFVAMAFSFSATFWGRGYEGRPEQFPTATTTAPLTPIFIVDGLFPLRSVLVGGAEGDEHPAVAHRPSYLANESEIKHEENNGCLLALKHP